MLLRLSALSAGCALPPRKIPVTHFCYRLVDLMTVVRQEGLAQLQNQWRLESKTCRSVSQRTVSTKNASTCPQILTAFMLKGQGLVFRILFPFLKISSYRRILIGSTERASLALKQVKCLLFFFHQLRCLVTLTGFLPRKLCQKYKV
jgi:hypothetical protein